VQSFWQKVLLQIRQVVAFRWAHILIHETGFEIRLRIHFDFQKNLVMLQNQLKNKKSFSKMTAEEWNHLCWTLNFAGARQSDHIAMFPKNCQGD